MTHYQDMLLLPDAEILSQVLMSILFGKLHKALAAGKHNDIGVSFPGAGAKFLGECLRVHGSKQGLDDLEPLSWLGGMRGYVRLKSVTLVPEHVLGYRCVSRRQAKSNPESLRRRMMKRKGSSWEDAVKAIPTECAERLDLPFVQLSSSSTGEKFCLFIEQGALLKSPKIGLFSCYGLSPIATIPWF